MQIICPAKAWREKEKYSRIVSREEIAKDDFNISPSRYIHTGAGEAYRPMAEIVEELQAFEKEPRENDGLLKNILGTPALLRAQPRQALEKPDACIPRGI
jgi:type I restriction-modification system DNA methylase subunit